MHSGQQGRIKTAVCDIEVEDMPKCRPIARILAYTILPDRAATGCPLGRGALADSVAGMRSGPRGYPARGSDWGFTAVHFCVAHPAAPISLFGALQRHLPAGAIAAVPHLDLQGDFVALDGALMDDLHFAAATVEMKIVHRSEEHTSELQSPCNLVC